MAEVIDRMPEKGVRKYPWALWLDGEPRKLTKGVDFDCDEAAMASGARLAGERRGLRVETSYNRESGHVYVQAIVEGAK